MPLHSLPLRRSQCQIFSFHLYVHFFLPNRVKMQMHMPNIQFCGYFDVPWKSLKACKSMNIWLLFVPCEAVFYLNCFKHPWATQYITRKHKFHIIWLYFMSRKRTLKQSISAQCWGHPRSFEEQGNKAMYYRGTRKDESKTRGPRGTTRSPEWHSHSRLCSCYATFFQSYHCN